MLLDLIFYCIYLLSQIVYFTSDYYRKNSVLFFLSFFQMHIYMFLYIFLIISNSLQAHRIATEGKKKNENRTETHALEKAKVRNLTSEMIVRQCWYECLSIFTILIANHLLFKLILLSFFWLIFIIDILMFFRVTLLHYCLCIYSVIVNCSFYNISPFT